MKNEIQEQIDDSQALVLECKTLKIGTTDDYRYAAGRRGMIKELIKALTDRAKPRIDEARQHLRNLQADLTRDIEPLETAYAQVGTLLVTYDTEQERVRRRAQLEAEAKARQEAEDQKKRMAELAKQMGDKNLAKEIQRAPLEVEPVVVVKDVPTAAETGVSYREDFHYRIVDELKIPRQYLIPDTVKIGKVVRALKRSASIPGIEIYSEKIPVQRT